MDLKLEVFKKMYLNFYKKNPFAAIKFPTNKNSRQTKRQVGAPDPKATADMDVDISDLVHSNILPFSFVEDMKLKKLMNIAMRLPSDYAPPNRHRVSG